MKNIILFPAKERYSEEAPAEWLAVLDRGNLSRSEKRDLQRWLNSDPRNLGRLTELAELWGEMESLSLLAEVFPEPRSARAAFGKSIVSGWLGNRAAGLAMACSLVLVAGAAIIIHNWPPVGQNDADGTLAEGVYRTRVGELSEVNLNDGSTVILNTQTTMRVRFDGTRRAVYLERGEAHFDVARNTGWPFVVYAGRGQVRAVGTAFSVRVEHWNVDVAVSEGKVEVVTESGSSGEENIRTISSGDGPSTYSDKPLTALTLSERGVASYDESIQAYDYVEAEEFERQEAWKSGKWIFNGETLEEVIAEASRYTEEEIVITDADIAGLRIGGYFQLGDLEPLLKTLERNFDVKVHRPNKGVIELSGTGENDGSKATL